MLTPLLMHCDIAGSSDFPDIRDPEFRLELDNSLCSATHRLFKVCDIYILSSFEKLVVQKLVISRSGASLRCNRATRPDSSATKPILRISSSIVYGCDWCFRFNWVVPGKRQGGDKVKIIYICRSHNNTCGSSSVDQLALAGTRAS